MEKYIKTSRIVVLAVIMALLLSVYGMTLYRIQAIDSEAILDDTESLTATSSVVHASRGSVLDRNGVLLTSDRAVYDVRISRSQLLQEQDPNGTVLRLIRAANKFGVEYSDIFPVTTTAPFEYYANMTSTQKSWMRSYFKYFSNSLNVEDPDDPGITATELISWMRGHYKLDYTIPAEEARRIIGVRFMLEMQPINYSEYVFASDVSDEFVSYLAEQNLPSVYIDTRSERVYHTPYAAHLLGYVGTMTRQQYDDKYKALGYPLNSTVGQTGVESAFEEYLHGVDGGITTYTDSLGAVNDVKVETEAQAGNNVYLSIDIRWQEVAERALGDSISQMNQDRTAAYEAAVDAAEAEGKDPETVDEPDLAVGGAAVMIDVNTGEVLALASYPTYDLSTFYENYSLWANDTVNTPLMNRATGGKYNPGSTFKMVTAFAALSSGTITTSTKIHDDGIFMEYADLHFTPRCWIYPGNHGDISVVQALEKSCNFFFFTVADQMGITPIAQAARQFGLGAHTGIEIGDNVGEVASVELKRDKYNEGWWSADTILASIGQGLNYFTPIQLANYVATISNGGTLRAATILRKVSSFDYSDVLLRREPRVMSVVDDPNNYISILQEGMRAVAATGTAASSLSSYPVPVAAKTGTVQNASSSVNDGVFVCYAPADDPQIAIAVVVEKGGSGSALISIATQMLDAYFADTAGVSQSVQPDNSLLK